jgi:hypothetical protein
MTSLLWRADAEFNAGLPGFRNDAAMVFTATPAQTGLGGKLRGQENEEANDNQPYHPPNEPGTLRHMRFLGHFRGGVKLEEGVQKETFVAEAPAPVQRRRGEDGPRG